MKTLHLTTDRIESTILKVCDFVDSQEKITLSWRDLHEEQLWCELVSCILGSRVRYETAKACCVHLNRVGLLNFTKILENPRNTKNKIRKELSKPIYPPFSDNIGSKYRYPNSKAQYIVKTAIEIYTKGNLSIRDILIGCNDGIEARNILMEKCFGIGPKQASLFLRNISFSNDLAIIDSHVDHYMKLLKSGGKMVKMNKQEVCPYFEKENALRIYAMSKKRSLATLDIGIWTVMRVIRKKD